MSYHDIFACVWPVFDPLAYWVVAGVAGDMGWHGSIQTEYFLGNPVLCGSVAVASTILVKVACSSSSICTWPPYPTSFSLSVAPKSLQFASTSIVCHRICPVVLVCVSFECVWSFVVVFCVVVAFCYPRSSNSLLTHSCALGCTCGCRVRAASEGARAELSDCADLVRGREGETAEPIYRDIPICNCA